VTSLIAHTIATGLNVPRPFAAGLGQAYIESPAPPCSCRAPRPTT